MKRVVLLVLLVLFGALVAGSGCSSARVKDSRYLGVRVENVTIRVPEGSENPYNPVVETKDGLTLELTEYGDLVIIHPKDTTDTFLLGVYLRYHNSINGTWVRRSQVDPVKKVASQWVELYEDPSDIPADAPK